MDGHRRPPYRETVIAVLAAVFALAGAPSVPVSCSPHLSADGRTGEAYLVEQRIVLRSDVCLGLKYVAADRAGRASIARAYLSRSHGPVPEGNPMGPVVAVALLTALHEAEHVALHSTDECLVEKTALAKLPTLLRQFFPAQWRSMLASARAFDGGLSAEYHGC
jgi:hypothetical protein